MRAQVYTVPVAAEDIGQALPGQMVFKSDSSDTVVGFISGVLREEGAVEVTLFEAGELPENGTAVTEELAEEDLSARFRGALRKNIRVLPEWGLRPSDLLKAEGGL